MNPNGKIETEMAKMEAKKKIKILESWYDILSEILNV